MDDTKETVSSIHDRIYAHAHELTDTVAAYIGFSWVCIKWGPRGERLGWVHIPISNPEMTPSYKHLQMLRLASIFAF